MEVSGDRKSRGFFAKSPAETEALYKNAVVCLYGNKQVERFVEKALTLLEKAVSYKHVPAMIELGEIYKTGFGGIAKNPEKAVFYLERAAVDFHDLSAARDLEQSYRRGEGCIPRDAIRAHDFRIFLAENTFYELRKANHLLCHSFLHPAHHIKTSGFDRTHADILFQYHEIISHFPRPLYELFISNKPDSAVQVTKSFEAFFHSDELITYLTTLQFNEINDFLTLAALLQNDETAKLSFPDLSTLEGSIDRNNHDSKYKHQILSQIRQESLHAHFRKKEKALHIIRQHIHEIHDNKILHDLYTDLATHEAFAFIREENNLFNRALSFLHYPQIWPRVVEMFKRQGLFNALHSADKKTELYRLKHVYRDLASRCISLNVLDRDPYLTEIEKHLNSLSSSP